MDPDTILKKYEHLVYLVLVALFAAIVAFSIVQLVAILYVVTLIVNTPGLLEDRELLTIIGYFLLVLIAVELLATISVYIKENVIHVETVIIVAIIAITRGVILYEPGKGDPLNMLGVAAIIFALCSGYYFLKKGGIHTA